MKRRLVGLAVGLAYAVFLGFLLATLTGGGHGNLWPVVLFVVTTMFGLFYPVMGFIAADLRSLFAKSVFIAIFLIHLILVFFSFSQGLIEGNSSPRDFSFNEHPIFFLIVSFLLSAPQVVLIGMFAFSLCNPNELSRE